jgi:hypothetical protein
MTPHLSRRRALWGCLALALLPRAARAQGPIVVPFMSAGSGSGFLPYAEGLARAVAPGGRVRFEVRQSGGSNDNLRAVNAEPGVIGTAFLASAHEALTGTGFAQGAAMANLVALFPMYETAFMTAALRRSGLDGFAKLDGKRVGAGPARGPAEGYFRMAAEIAGVRATIVSGAPADLVRQLLAGEIDALWQGANIPIPSLVQVTNQADAVVFGLPQPVADGMRARSPVLVPATIAPGAYRGQGEPIASVAAWNAVVAHKDLPEATAYAVTHAVLSVPDLVAIAGPVAAGTKAANAGANRVLPYHPGAARALRELGATLP